MSNIDPSSRKQMVANMSGEFIRAAINNEEQAFGMLNSSQARQNLARNCVALAEEHMQALEANFARPSSDKH